MFPWVAGKGGCGEEGLWQFTSPQLCMHSEASRRGYDACLCEDPCEASTRSSVFSLLYTSSRSSSRRGKSLKNSLKIKNVNVLKEKEKEVEGNTRPQVCMPLSFLEPSPKHLCFPKYTEDFSGCKMEWGRVFPAQCSATQRQAVAKTPSPTPCNPTGVRCPQPWARRTPLFQTLSLRQEGPSLFVAR